jgi:hypothetical protein
VATSTIRTLDQPVPPGCTCGWCDQPAILVKQWKTENMPCSSFWCACADHADKLQQPEKQEVTRDTYTVEPGRNIYRNGEPLISTNLGMKVGEPNWNPSEADDLTHVICALLNERQPKKGERS